MNVWACTQHCCRNTAATAVSTAVSTAGCHQVMIMHMYKFALLGPAERTCVCVVSAGVCARSLAAGVCLCPVRRGCVCWQSLLNGCGCSLVLFVGGVEVQIVLYAHTLGLWPNAVLSTHKTAQMHPGCRWELHRKYFYR